MLANTEAGLMELEIAGTCPTKHGLVGDAWNAELWPGMLSRRLRLFPNDATSDWRRILTPTWCDKGVEDCVFWGVLKGVGLTSRNRPLF